MCKIYEIIEQIEFLPIYDSKIKRRPTLRLVIAGGAFPGKAEWLLTSKKTKYGEICACGTVVDTECPSSNVNPLPAHLPLSSISSAQEQGAIFQVSAV